jgi:hypothetical protein
MCEIVAGEWWTDEYMVKPIGVLDRPTASMVKAAALEQREEKSKVEEGWVVISS